jgi:class 3 adenylate cyclase
MSWPIIALLLVPTFSTVLPTHGSADAAEIMVWTSRAIATVLAEIGGEFERATGHRLTITTDLPPHFSVAPRRRGAVRSFDDRLSPAR